MLVALLPILAKGDQRTPLEKVQFNHYTLGIALDTLITAERNGILINCSDGQDRLCHPVPAQCVVDLMEAYKLAGVPDKSCMKCHIPKAQMQDLTISVRNRDSERWKYLLLEAWETQNVEAILEYSERSDTLPILVGPSNA